MTRATRDFIKLIGAGIVTLVLLVAGLYVLLFKSHASEGLQKFAASWIGLAAGYWFK